jgi:hypothetical protein
MLQDLTYTVLSNSNKGEKVALLKNLTGCFSPGQMSALVRFTLRILVVSLHVTTLTSEMRIFLLCSLFKSCPRVRNRYSGVTCFSLQLSVVDVILKAMKTASSPLF